MHIFLKVLGLDVGKITLYEIVNLSCTSGMFLVRSDDLSIQIQLGTLSHLQQSRKVGIALVAVLTIEATHLLAVHLIRLLTPPNAPIMHIAFGQALGSTPTFRGRAGPVGARRRPAAGCFQTASRIPL